MDLRDQIALHFRTFENLASHIDTGPTMTDLIDHKERLAHLAEEMAQTDALIDAILAGKEHIDPDSVNTVELLEPLDIADTRLTQEPGYRPAETDDTND